MAIATTDLIAYAAASMPLDDVSTSGGAIDPLRRVVFTDISATGTIELLSDGADTRTFTITGRLASGVYVSEGPTSLNGATPVTTSNSFERVLSVELSATSASRTVTVRKASDDVTIGTIPVNEQGFMRLFRNSLGEAGGGSTRTYYEKFFWKNVHGSLSLLSAAITQSADPSANITHTLAAAVDDTNSVTNRLTAPGASIIEPDSFDDTSKNVPGTNLAAGAAIGVWLKHEIAPGEAPYKNTYTSQISGNST